MENIEVKKSYSTGEEIFNAVSHGVGAGLSAAAIALLAVFGRKTGTVMTSVAIYGASLFMLYMMSTMYHALTNIRAKRVFQILDHCSIYFLIAGTYTPFCLIFLGGALGWTIAGIIWGLAVFGITIYSVVGNKLRKISSITYVFMGWLIVFACRPLYNALSSVSFKFFALGGLAYTVGFPFYAMKKVKWMHSVFHMFILVGSILHFWCVFLAVQ